MEAAIHNAAVSETLNYLSWFQMLSRGDSCYCVHTNLHLEDSPKITDMSIDSIHNEHTCEIKTSSTLQIATFCHSPAFRNSNLFDISITCLKRFVFAILTSHLRLNSTNFYEINYKPSHRLRLYKFKSEQKIKGSILCYIYKSD